MAVWSNTWNYRVVNYKHSMESYIIYNISFKCKYIVAAWALVLKLLHTNFCHCLTALLQGLGANIASHKLLVIVCFCLAESIKVWGSQGYHNNYLQYLVDLRKI